MRWRCWLGFVCAATEDSPNPKSPGSLTRPRSYRDDLRKRRSKALWCTRWGIRPGVGGEVITALGRRPVTCANA